MCATSHHLHLYNLPQNIDGGIVVKGLFDKNNNEIVIRFHHLDGMGSYCTVDGDDSTSINLPADTKLEELGNDEYRVEKE